MICVDIAGMVFDTSLRALEWSGRASVRWTLEPWGRSLYSPPSGPWEGRVGGLADQLMPDVQRL